MYFHQKYFQIYIFDNCILYDNYNIMFNNNIYSEILFSNSLVVVHNTYYIDTKFLIFKLFDVFIILLEINV